MKEKRDKGECNDCSKPAVPGKGGRCEQHHKEQLKYTNKRNEQKRLTGECYHCLKPVVPGKGGYCVEHYEKRLKYREKYRENKNAIS